jgi:transposase
MPGRAGMWAAKLLGDYHGILQVDGYEAYGQFGKANRPGGASVLAYCWAHVRRGFFDAAKGEATPIAQEALRRIGQIYEIEREINGRAPDERLAIRMARSQPLVEDLRQWLDEKRRRMFSGSPTLGAINYALNHWVGLVRFLKDGRIDLDNNPVERAMRPVALQRKNALFAGHELGAENWAAIASLVETCKLGDINPSAYLADVLARIVTRNDGDPIDDLLPANWVDTNAARAMFEMNDIAQAA